MRPGDSESRDAMRAKLAEGVERLRMRPLSELPNTEGFRFVGIRHDGPRGPEPMIRTRGRGLHDGG
jgi:hypothetical protein